MFRLGRAGHVPSASRKDRAAEVWFFRFSDDSRSSRWFFINSSAAGPSWRASASINGYGQKSFGKKLRLVDHHVMISLDLYKFESTILCHVVP